MGNSNFKHLLLRCLLLTTLSGLLLITSRGPLQASSDSAERAVVDGDGALISDGLFLYATSVLAFDSQAFLDSQMGPLADYVETINGQAWTASESIHYNAILHGLNPQVILTVLEAQNQLLTDPDAAVPKRSASQADAPNERSFHQHVRHLAQHLLLSYDAHRAGELRAELLLPSGKTVDLSDAPNAGTYAVQASLARSMSRLRWESWVQGPQPRFSQQFSLWFGDPLLMTDQTLAEESATPAGYILPFPIGETWYYTGGPHNYSGGVPGCVSGYSCPRPWSALDMAPPELMSCPSASYPVHRWVVAAKNGTVIESSQALIVIDHGDGWRTYYSHLASANRRGIGPVERGDLLGHPSCEVEPGGFTTGVHVHFALYRVGTGFVDVNGMTFSGWLVGETSHYNGTMRMGGDMREASTGRHSGLNDIWNNGVGGVCPVSGSVLLFKHINFDCDGDGAGSGYVQRSDAGFQDLPVSFDDSASSLRVPPGWSVRLYEHRGRRGASVCRNADDPNFTGDTFEGSGGPLNDQISSIEVFEVADCAGPYSGGFWSITYFDDLDVANPCAAASTLEGSYVFQDWGAESPTETCPTDNWSARFTRYAYFPSGTYIFGLSADDRARIKIGGQPVIDNWNGSGQQYGSQTLPAGSYEVTVEYADQSGKAYVSAWWWGPGYEMRRDDQDPNQWYARYWANRDLLGDPVALVNEGTSSLNHAWASEGPGHHLPADRFGSRFERLVLLGCGSYHFQLQTDDGARFWIDDTLLLDAWYDQVATHDVFVNLEVAKTLDLKIEHYENGGLATIRLDWTRQSFCPLPEVVYLPRISTTPLRP
jgi:hypothetical protein